MMLFATKGAYVRALHAYWQTMILPELRACTQAPLESCYPARVRDMKQRNGAWLRPYLLEKTTRGY